MINYHTQVRFLISPDKDFSTAGFSSGIEYSKSFTQYKEMLIEDYESAPYQRIFAEFDAAVFDKVRAVSDKFVVDDGDYSDQVAKFKRELRAEEAAREEEAASAEGDKTPLLASPCPPSPPLPSSPTTSLQSDHRVSVSATSNVSHTTVTLSQVATVVNNSMTPHDDEVTESLPPVRKNNRPAPRQKVKSTAVASDIDPNTVPAAPTRNKRPTKQVAATPGDPPTRRLRNRG